MRRALLLLAALLAASSAQGGPRSIDDCEAIKEAMAYNACLASFGPERGRRASPPAGGASARAYHRAQASRWGAGVAARRGRGGRVHVEFTPRHG